MEISNFFPKIVLDVLKDEDDLEKIYEFYGGCLFADISGFTSLSEAFARFGSEGTEVLTKTINNFFEKLYIEIKKYNGDIIRFAGDAITVFYEGKDGLKNSIESANKMMEIVKEFHNIEAFGERFSFNMKIGISSGKCNLFFLKSEEKLEYVFSGEPVNDSAKQEHLAKPGEIMVSKKIKDLKDLSYGSDKKQNKDILMKFLHPKVLEVIEKGDLWLLNAHRNVIVIFINAGEKLNIEDYNEARRFFKFYNKCSNFVLKYNGYINKIDCGDKGNVIIVLFGAPVSYGDNLKRALEFLIDLKKISNKIGFPFKAGLSSEVVFSGIVGCKDRFEYTVMGDGVNLSARLMQAALFNSVLVSRNIINESSKEYVFQNLPPIYLKGKERAQEVANFLGKGTEKIKIPFFIGRKEELEKLKEKIFSYNENKTFLCYIEGEQGIGKSYFLSYFLENYLSSEEIIFSRCYSYNQNISFYIFQKLILEIFNRLKLPFSITLKDKIYYFLNENFKDMQDYFSLIFEFIGLEFEEKEKKIDPELKKGFLRRFILTVLEYALKNFKIYWVIENAHWIDLESKELLNYILIMIENQNFKIFFVGRENIFGEDNIITIKIKLKNFNLDEANFFSKYYLNAEEIPKKALMKAYEFSGGNPILHQEILKFMLNSGFLLRSEDFPQILIIYEKNEPKIPNTFEEIIISNLDKLPLEEKITLMQLSVFGDNIQEGLIPKLEINQQTLNNILKKGEFLSYNPLFKNYFFKKHFIREVIYNSLEFTFKRSAHYKIAKAIEIYLGREKLTEKKLLAYHYSEAKAKEGIEFLKEIYEKAKKSFLLKEAISHLQKLIEICKIHKVEKIQKYILDLAECYIQAGRAADSYKLLIENKKNFENSFLQKFYLAISEAEKSRGKFKDAIDYAEKSINLSMERKEKFLGLFTLGRILSMTGNFEKAEKIYIKILNNFKEMRNDIQFHLSKINLNYIKYGTKKPDYLIKEWEKEKKWFFKRKNIREYLTILNNIGILYLDCGFHKKAMKNFEVGIKALSKYGIYEPEMLLKFMLNLSLQYLYLNRLNEAKKEIEAVISYSKRFNFPSCSETFYSMFYQYIGDYKKSYEILTKSIKDIEEGNFFDFQPYEIGMDISYELKNLTFFQKMLNNYRVTIDKNKLFYLNNSLLNYEAEFYLLKDKNKVSKDLLIKNYKECLKSLNYPESYRSLRALYILTENLYYIKKMKEIVGKIDRFFYKFDFFIYFYEKYKNEKNKKKLKYFILKSPENVLKLRAYIALKDFKNAKNLYNKIKENLPIEWKNQFEKFYGDILKCYDSDGKIQLGIKL